MDPKGPNCRRIFNSPDPLKAYNAWVPVEKVCKAGVLDGPALQHVLRNQMASQFHSV